MAKKDTETLASIKLPVKRLDGSPTGEEVTLDPKVFGLPRNDHVMYLAVKAELSNRRQGTAATKTRALISGGGKKPWKQKGRGGARAGSNRSPIWKGGGTMFGPQPHYYLQFIPTRVKRLARRVALSVKAQGGFIDILEDFEFEAPKTGRIAETLRAFGASGNSALIMVDGNKPSVVKSCRNIPRLAIRDGVGASTYDIMRARKLLICKSALEKLVGGLSDE